MFLADEQHHPSARQRSFVTAGESVMDNPTILVVNPNTSQAMTAAIDRVAQAAAGSIASVVTIRSHNGPHTIEGALDTALATAGMLEVVAAHKDPFDALVVACFSDPGVEALRILTRVPVIGIGAASFMHAACLSQHFAIVTPVSSTQARYAAVAAAMGLDSQFVGAYPTPLSVADFESDDPAVLETLVFHAEQAVKNGADCLLFGCAGIADQVHDIEARVGVTCVASAAAGVSQAIACLQHRRAPIAGGPFHKIKIKPLAGFEALQPHYQGRQESVMAAGQLPQSSRPLGEG
jgi:allantoin racemase